MIFSPRGYGKIAIETMIVLCLRDVSLMLGIFIRTSPFSRRQPSELLQDIAPETFSSSSALALLEEGSLSRSIYLLKDDSCHEPAIAQPRFSATDEIGLVISPLTPNRLQP